MDATMFKANLAEIMNDISAMPARERDSLEMQVRETQGWYAELQQKQRGLQESLDALRNQVKYLAFAGA